MIFEEAMEYLAYANQFAGALGLDNIRELLHRLGNPQEQLKFIHIGGTNGKGSTGAYISSILAMAGYRIGRYISPTVFCYCERIQMTQLKTVKNPQDNALETCYISEEAVARHVTKIKAVIEEIQKEQLPHPTPFEIETAMSFMEFVEQQCDFVVLEVGLGGRLDATNIIRTAECIIFSSISKDHMQFLGNTLEEITTEKAGIIKEGAVVVSYDYEKERNRIIPPILKQVCERKNAVYKQADFQKLNNVIYSMEGSTFDYREYKHLYTPILGENQVRNAAVAIEAVCQLTKKGYYMKEEHIRRGIKNTVWRGRFELLKKEPYYIVDGAHNEDGAKSLKESIQIYLKGKKLLYIMGILADKEYRQILNHTAYCADKILTITPENTRALPSFELAKVAREYCKDVEDCQTISKALKRAEELEKNYEGILIFGSLYYLGEVYRLLGK